MSGESWHEERDRLEKLLQAIKDGTVTHIDEQKTELLTSRLAELNKRLGNKTK